MSSQTQTPEVVRHVKRDIGGPRHNPQIEEWLSLLCGNQFDKVLDWLAIAPDLDKPLCALVFKGVSASGKTLFIQGLASIWADAPASDIVSSFNEDFARCPIVSIENPRSINQELALIDLGELSRPLHRKYQAPTILEGALRYILVLSERTEESLTAGQQFLHVRPSSEARDYLDALPLELKTQWRMTEIGRYVLWLAVNRKNH